MVESLVNYYTIEHFIFGLGIAAIITILNRTKHKVFSVSFFIVILWELFELKEYTNYWITNYLNNIMDIFIGLVGIIIMNNGINFIEDRMHHTSRLAQN